MDISSLKVIRFVLTSYTSLWCLGRHGQDDNLDLRKEQSIYLLEKCIIVSYINFLGFSGSVSLKGLMKRKIHFFDQ